MTDLLERLRKLLRARTPRERWMLAGASCVVALFIVQSLWIRPLQSRTTKLDHEIVELREQIRFASRIVVNIRQLQGPLTAVERRIGRSAQSDLLSLIEGLAREAGLGPNQIESVTPKPPSANPSYPEKRVEVRLKGTTLQQTVRFLYRIENASQLLIIRSLRITTRGSGQPALDVSFSVSTFVHT